MILDQLGLFSNAQAITADAPSTNHVDLGAPGITAYNPAQLRRRLGRGKCVPLLVQVVEAFNTLTSLTISIQVDEDPAFGSPTTVYSEVINLAQLVVGRKILIDRLPRGINERYIRLFYDVTGTNPTLGKITAGFVGAVDEGYQGHPASGI